VEFRCTVGWFPHRPLIGYRVDADKGFNFSLQDDSFVCQKKNHFQVTLHVSVEGCAKFVKLPDGGAAQITGFYVNFNGIKVLNNVLIIINKKEKIIIMQYLYIAP